MQDAQNISNRGWLLILLAACLVWFCNLEVRKLVGTDEGRYAEIPREMVASGDWVTPRLDGLKYFEKPALQYWVTASAYEVFGEHHWTARLWTALTGFLGLLAVFYCGRVLFGREAGISAALVLGSAFLYVLMAHALTLDMGVTFFMTVTLCALLLSLRDNASPREQRNWMWTAWAVAALAMLSKGLQAVVLPGAVFVLYTLIERDWASWKKLRPVGGLSIFLVITVPWFVAVSTANPEFPQYFFIHEHFERFLTKVHGRFQPWWWFIPILLAGMLPWTALLFDAFRDASRRQPAQRFQPKRFLLVWSVFIFVFFSASDSKLVAYILPVFPSLALLLGARLQDMPRRRFVLLSLPVIPLALAGIVMAAILPRYASDETPAALFSAYGPWLIAACVALLAGCGAALTAERRGKRLAAVALLAAGGLLFEQIAITGFDSFSPSQSSYSLVEKAMPELVATGAVGKEDIPFYSVGMYDQALPFYIKRTVTLVATDYEDVQFGIKRQPEKYVPTVEEFERRWRADGRALAIMKPDRYRALAAAGLPMRLIAQDTRRAIVAKP